MSFVGYQDAAVQIRKLPEDAFAEAAIAAPLEDVVAVSLAKAKASPTGSYLTLLVYVAAVHQRTTRPLGTRTVSVEEITMRDELHKQTVATFYEEATGSVKKGGFYLIKRARKYGDDLLIRGYSMVVACPEDLRFSVEGEAVEL